MKKKRGRRYQPVWRNGQEERPGKRSSADRYHAILQHLSWQLRGSEGRHHVLDVGAAQCYFANRLAEDLPQRLRITAVDREAGLEGWAGPDVRAERMRITAPMLRGLCPKPGVVLALSILHHLPDWREVLRWAVGARLGAYVEVAVPIEQQWMRTAPARGEIGETAALLEQAHRSVAGVELLGWFPRIGHDGSEAVRPLYWLPGLPWAAQLTPALARWIEGGR